MVHDLSLSQDSNSICSNGCRIAKCMKEYFFFKKNYRGALNSISLAKSMHHKLWDNSPYLLKQLPGIGMVTAKALHSMGINSFETLDNADPRRIEIVANRKFPFGDHIKESLLSLPPKVELKIVATDAQRQGKSKLAVTLTRLTEARPNKRHYADLVVGLEEENVIIYHEKIRVDDFLSPYHTTVPLPNHQNGKLTARADLIFDEFIGIDLHHKVELMGEIRSEVAIECGTKRSSLPSAKVSARKATKGMLKLAKEQPIPIKIDEEVDDMPSFKLIDDELDGGFVDDKASKDDIKVVSGHTIFDHIREKAKDFPVVTKSSDIHFSVSEASNLPTKRSYVHAASGESEHSGNLENGEASVDQETNDALESTGIFRIKIEGSGKEGRRMEPTLDHVRKRSKNLPIMIKQNTGVSSLFADKEQQALKYMNFVKTEEKLQSEPSVGSLIILDHPETIENEYNASSPSENFKGRKHASWTSNRSLDLPFEVFNYQSNPMSITKSSFNCSLPRKEIQFEPPGGSKEPEVGKISNHLMEGNRGVCSLEIAGRNKNVDSFLGCQSVFSFL